MHLHIEEHQGAEGHGPGDFSIGLSERLPINADGEEESNALVAVPHGGGGGKPASAHPGIGCGAYQDVHPLLRIFRKISEGILKKILRVDREQASGSAGGRPVCGIGMKRLHQQSSSGLQAVSAPEAVLGQGQIYPVVVHEKGGFLRRAGFGVGIDIPERKGIGMILNAAFQNSGGRDEDIFPIHLYQGEAVVGAPDDGENRLAVRHDLIAHIDAGFALRGGNPENAGVSHFGGHPDVLCRGVQKNLHAEVRLSADKSGRSGDGDAGTFRAGGCHAEPHLQVGGRDKDLVGPDFSCHIGAAGGRRQRVGRGAGAAGDGDDFLMEKLGDFLMGHNEVPLFRREMNGEFL